MLRLCWPTRKMEITSHNMKFILKYWLIRLATQASKIDKIDNTVFIGKVGSYIWKHEFWIMSLHGLFGRVFDWVLFWVLKKGWWLIERERRGFRNLIWPSEESRKCLCRRLYTFLVHFLSTTLRIRQRSPERRVHTFGEI